MSRGSVATSNSKFLNYTITSWRDLNSSNPLDVRNSIESDEIITNLNLNNNKIRIGGVKKNIRAL